MTYGPPEAPYRSEAAGRRVQNTGPGWYRGDLHTHTVHSDGRATPAQLLADAEAAGLDFLVSTEHNNQSASLQWGRHDTDLLVIDGEEVTTRSGHWIAAGIPAGSWIDWRYRAADGALADHLRQVHGLGGLAIVAHPHAPFSGTRWEFGYDGIDAVELMNGPWTSDDQFTVDWWHARLVAGEFLPAVASSDTHGRTPGLPQTVVHAEELSVGAILEGVRRGRAWLAESADVGLSMATGGPGRWAGIGERVDAARPGDVVRLQVDGVPGCVAVLRSDAAVLGTAVAGAAGHIDVQAPIPVGAGTFVRAEVRRPSADVQLDPTAGTPGGPVVALTNPIFY